MSTDSLFNVVQSRLHHLRSDQNFKHIITDIDIESSLLFVYDVINCFDHKFRASVPSVGKSYQITPLSSRLADYSLLGLFSLYEDLDILPFNFSSLDEVTIDFFSLERQPLYLSLRDTSQHLLFLEASSNTNSSILNLLACCSSPAKNTILRYCHTFLSRFPLCAFKSGEEIFHIRKSVSTSFFFDKAPFLLVQPNSCSDLSVTFTDSYRVVSESLLSCDRLLVYSPLPYMYTYIIDASSAFYKPLSTHYFTASQSHYLQMLCQ